MIDVNQHDRFVVTRRRRVTWTPSLEGVDVYEFALEDPDADAAPVCRVCQRLSRSNVRIGFFADDARTAAVMYLDMRARFDPWARCELIDADLNPIGGIQKAFAPRRHRSYYVLSDSDGEEIARVEARVPAMVGRRRVGQVAVVAAAGVLGVPLIGAVGVTALAALGVTAAIRHVREWVDPLDVASELRLQRADQTIGVIRRRALPTVIGWESPETVYEIDMGADPAKRVDRRLALAVPVALDTLRGVFAESALR